MPGIKVGILDNIIERAPKEGYKSAVVLGLINSLRNTLIDLNNLVEKVQCLGQATGGCKDSYCNSSCSGITLTKYGDTIIVTSYKDNAFGATISGESVIIRTKSMRITVSGTLLKIEYPSKDGWIVREVELNRYDDVYNNGYDIKYALKNVSKPIKKSLMAIATCSRSKAIPC